MKNIPKAMMRTGRILAVWIVMVRWTLSLSAILGNGATFAEQLASIAHDAQLVCEFFRVNNKNIFNGEMLRGKV